MPDGTNLSEFAAWCQKHVTGDEKGDAQIFLDRLFQAFGHAGLKEAGATLEFRVTKAAEAGSGIAFADFVWKPAVLVERKKRGENLQKLYRQAFDYWTRLVPNRPRCVVLCNFGGRVAHACGLAARGMPDGGVRAYRCGPGPIRGGTGVPQ